MDTRNEFQRRIGVGEPSHVFAKYGNTPRRRRVVADDGPARGTVTGIQTDHADGRMDATVVATPTWISPALEYAARTEGAT